MNLKKTLDSGATLEVTMASFEVGHKLLKCVMREVEGVKLSLGVKAKTLQDFFAMEINDEALNTLKNVVTRLIGSDTIDEALWPCMERALYNNQRVSRDLFEDERNRADYLVVAKEVLLFNLSPFLKNLSSLFQGSPTKTTESQR